MTRSFLVLLFLITILPGQVAAQRMNLGIGVILGDPISLTAKKWLSKTTAIDGAFARTNGQNGDDGTFEIHVDYLKHDFKLIRLEAGTVPIHYGIGVKIQSGDEAKTSLRIPVGVSFIFQQAPVSLFYEHAFLFDLSTQDTIKSETNLGFRYYF